VTQRRNDDPTDESARDERLVAGLVRVSGARAEPPREDYEHVFAAASAAFERTQTLRRRRREGWSVALAASFAGALALLMWSNTAVKPGAPVSTVARLVGDVTIRTPGASMWTPLPVDYSIPERSSIRTGPASAAALSLASGVELRLDAGSEAVLEKSHRVRLERGALYADSGSERRSGARSAFEVVTDRATARDIGTQFEVRLTGERYRLRVREGRVVLAHERGRSLGVAGEELSIMTSGRIERSRVARDDPGWQWVATVASPPDIDNQPLQLVLDWITRETGRTIRYSSRETEELASAAILHGSIRGLEPLAALETVLATSELGYQIMADGSILITAP
jgi:ferric-dicitrate binding protein FerR (iron transport regulator)